MGKTIADLSALQAVSDETLIPVYQPGAADPAQKMKGKQFREFAEQAAKQYVDGATDAAERAEAALAALGNDAQIAKKAAADAAESEKKSKLYADQTEASVSGVASFNGRGGHVLPQSGDYTADMVGAAPAMLTVATRCATPGWYRIGTINTAGLNCGAARIIIVGQFNISSPRTQIVDVAFDHTGRFITKAVDTVGASNVTKIRLWRIDNFNVAVDVYYAPSVENFVRVFIEQLFGIFTTTAFENVTDLTGSAFTECDLSECENPPMENGVEYRTTERINGVAVYKRNNGGVIEYRLDGETEWKPYLNANGNAPAGFGLGKDAVALDSADIKKPNGWYEAWFTHNSDADPPNGTHLFRNDMRRSGLGYQTLYGYIPIDGINRPFSMTRCVLGDERLPWEWVNPPMQPGVEYRTTKRFKGRPVYQRIVPLGWLAAGDHEFDIENVPATSSTTGIDVRLYNNDHELISFGTGVAASSLLGRAGSYLKLRFTLTVAHGSVDALIEYTK